MEMEHCCLQDKLKKNAKSCIKFTLPVNERAEQASTLGVEIKQFHVNYIRLLCITSETQLKLL